MSKKFGATGEFPEGKLGKHDEGQLQFGIAHADGKVILNFGKPVAWMGMAPEQARELAEHLIHHAQMAEKDYQ